jgi:anti-anti-sigma factor
MPVLRTETLAEGVGLRLSGELADSNALMAQRTFANLAVVGGVVTLDMGGVSFMDSLGLGKLIVLARDLTGRGHLRLVNVQPQLMRVFEVVSPRGRGLANMTVEPAPVAAGGEPLRGRAP